MSEPEGRDAARTEDRGAPGDPGGLPDGIGELAFGGLATAMGVELLEASAERVVARMPVKGNTQPYGILHGGASCVLAESAGSLGAAIHAGPDRIVMGIEINATHHRAATTGYVTAVATRVHGGRTVASYEIAISDDQKRRICTARLTCAIRDRA